MSDFFLKTEEIKAMIDEIKEHDLIPLNEMPEYDLLVSQIVDFFNLTSLNNRFNISNKAYKY